MTVAPTSRASTTAAVAYADPAALCVSLAQLRAGAVPGVDPQRKELYLSDADFEAAMRMTRAEYATLKPWQQRKRKKSARLF